MGLGLKVKEEVFLTETDEAALQKVARTLQRSKSSIIREALLESLIAKGYLREEKEAVAPKKETLGGLLESERQKRTPANER
jgi:predicted transcriptional regulator